MARRSIKKGIRYRCHHPSGEGVHPYCMAPAVDAVRVRFGKRWSKPLPACDSHAGTKEWYKAHDTEKWLPLRKSSLKVYAQHLR